VFSILESHIYKPFLQITQSPKIKHNTSEFASSHFKQLLSSRLFQTLPDIIQQTINDVPYTNKSVVQTLQFENGHTATVFLVLYDSAENSTTYLEKVRGWLEFLSSFANPTCSQHLDIYLALTDEKKQLPTSREIPIGPEHANTAFTYACLPHNQIFVYRREEWFKVFMHETFHSFGLDFATASKTLNEKCNRRFQQLFPRIDLGIDIRIYETYCEIWAEIMQMLFTSSGQKSIFNKILAEEQQFAIQQAQKVLNHSGITYSELREKDSDGPAYTEITSVLSYYVIRAAILLKIDKFIDFCKKNERIGPHIMQFDITDANIENYCTFVRECCIDREFVRAMKSSHRHNTNSLRITNYG